MNFENKIIKFIDEHQLFEPGDKVLLAVSGGADSTALLHLFAKLKEKLGIDVYCAHINHNLRAEDSQRDQKFVKKLSEQLSIEMIAKSVDVKKYAAKNKLSIETAARDLRRNELTKIAKLFNCGKIVTAHHKNDNAETVIQRIARGTGFKGLGGIWPKKRIGEIVFVRPLLAVTRGDIEKYLNDNKFDWQHDYTNDDIVYRRNFIRHKLLPVAQKNCRQSLTENLSRLSLVTYRMYEKINKRAADIFDKIAVVKEKEAVINAVKLRELSPLVQIEIVRTAFDKIGCGQQQVTGEHYNKILEIAQSKEGGRKIELPNKYYAVKEYDNLILAKKNKTSNASKEKVEIKIGKKTKFKNFTVETCVLNADSFDLKNYIKTKSQNEEIFDFEKIKFPLYVRFRRQGDKFIPFGSSSVKNVGKFLTSQKVAAGIRKKLLVICDCENIIWLWPVRNGDAAKITAKTMKIIKISIAEG